jgi:AAA+ superfamily predicted ATPase
MSASEPSAQASVRSSEPWLAANQAFLVAEFVRLKQRLSRDASPAAPAQALPRLPSPPAIDTLVETFGLSTFERDLVLLAAGVEMDADLATLCARARGDASRPWPSFGLALSALAAPHWSATSPVRPLRRFRLLEVDESSGLAQGRIRIDERVLHYLAGLNYLDPRLAPVLRSVGDPSLMGDEQAAVAARVLRGLEAGNGRLPVVQLEGDDAPGQEDVAARAAAGLGLRLSVLAARDLPESAYDAGALCSLWEREAGLLSSALLIECGADAPSPAVSRFVERVGGLVFLSAARPGNPRRPSLRFTVRRSSQGEQKRLWSLALGPAAAGANGELDRVSAQFRFSARTISETAAALVAAPEGSAKESLWSTCRSLAPARLDELAQRIEPSAGWDDLILPDAQKRSLQLIAAHVRHRLKVYDDWGFAEKSPRGQGISVLFAGESGTGKTMAGEVLARELGLDLYRIDLSAVVSKYIGETEKNLRRVFDAAEDSGSILLFDEADALFGKRSEVKDSHDRYANIEVSYLLQSMEAYRGLAVLTTNRYAALDSAFHRRLRFVVQFPFPDAEQRAAIWRGVFPAAVPLGRIDFDKLSRLNVSGGNIRNIALNAAFFAAEAESELSMAHLLRAARSEVAKRDRPITEVETRGWV